MMIRGVPKIPRIPFAFVFKCNQLYGNSVDVYCRITIQQICINQKNGNLVVQIKIINIYLFPKLNKLQFGGPQMYQFIIGLITLKLKCKWNRGYSECTNKGYLSFMTVTVQWWIQDFSIGRERQLQRGICQSIILFIFFPKLNELKKLFYLLLD